MNEILKSIEPTEVPLDKRPKKSTTNKAKLALHAKVYRAAEAHKRKEEEEEDILAIREKLGVTIKIDQAREILGQDNVFGAEAVEKAFGIKLTEIPLISYSHEQLVEAAKNGDKLILRLDKDELGKPLNLKNIIRLRAKKAKSTLGSRSEIRNNLDWASELSFAKDEIPKGEWKLISTKKVDGTEHLSYNAQIAFMEGNEGALAEAIQDIPVFWREIWGENFENGPDGGEVVKKAEENLPSVATLLALRKQFPNNATLPRVAEAVYDHIITYENTGKTLIPHRAIATNSLIPEMSTINEPARPWDVAFIDNGQVALVPCATSFNNSGETLLHSRRSMRMGRPHQLGDNEPGVSVSYMQY